ncbi:MAG: hypothetical protein WBG73_15250 [Coleofasciculaceae cyanobacterium]
MNAARRSVLPQRRRSRKPTANSKVTHFEAASASTARQKVEKLNTASSSLPNWLSPLLFIQRSSDIVTFVLVASTLTLYSWTVYTQQQWSQDYRKLENLQRDERHLTTTNAVIKDQLATLAEKPATGLVSPSPANTIFLTPAPQRQVRTNPNQTANSEPAAKNPLGY